MRKEDSFRAVKRRVRRNHDWPSPLVRLFDSLRPSSESTRGTEFHLRPVGRVEPLDVEACTAKHRCTNVTEQTKMKNWEVLNCIGRNSLIRLIR